VDCLLNEGNQMQRVKADVRKEEADITGNIKEAQQIDSNQQV
jgi:hypothetical protein